MTGFDVDITLNPLQFVAEACNMQRLLRDKIQFHREKLVLERFVETRDLYEDCIDSYPDFAERFTRQLRKEQAFAESDSSLSLDSPEKFVTIYYGWRRRLDSRFLGLLSTAEPDYDDTLLRARLVSDLEEHHQARLKIVRWGAMIRAEMDPIMRRFTFNRCSTDDIDKARDLSRAMLGQVKAVEQFIS